MMHRVLFVCEANVCRSPLMEFAFLANMPPDKWRADSGGTHLRAGPSVMCGVAARIAGVSSSAHTPGQVTLNDIQRSQLIITTSRAERAAIAVLAPGMRWKVFTLRESNILAAQPFTDAEMSDAVSGSRHMDELERYAISLHRRRGLVKLPAPRRRSLFGRALQHPLDINDVHGEKAPVHQAALTELVAQVRVLGNHLSTAITVRSESET